MFQSTRERDREKYLIYAKLDKYKRAEARAAEIVAKAALLSGRWLLSCSGGKDSIVLLDLVYAHGIRPDVETFIYSEFETPPENSALVESECVRRSLKFIPIHAYSCKEAWDEVGHFYCIPTTDHEKKLAKFADTDFRIKATQIIKSGKYDGVFWGLRKGESKRRNLSLSVNGDTYWAKCRGCFTCNPLAEFSADDVWAYIFSHDLKYLPVYDTAGFDRREIRNELNYMCNKKAIFNGIFQNYQLLYPQVIYSLRARYGELEI